MPGWGRKRICESKAKKSPRDLARGSKESNRAKELTRNKSPLSERKRGGNFRSMKKPTREKNKATTSQLRCSSRRPLYRQIAAAAISWTSIKAHKKSSQGKGLDRPDSEAKIFSSPGRKIQAGNSVRGALVPGGRAYDRKRERLILGSRAAVALEDQIGRAHV